MKLLIDRQRAEAVLQELAELLQPKIQAELSLTPVTVGYGIRIKLRQPPAENFEWIAVYRGIPVIYDQHDCDLDMDISELS